MVRRSIAGRRVGDLENEILDVLWSTHTALSGREVLELLENGPRAYTTVMTVLGRLVDKSLVERVEEGKVFLYRAAGDVDELTAQAIHSLLSATAHPKIALAHFIESLDDPELVAELTSVMKRERRP